jgi:hypothetical protein
MSPVQITIGGPPNARTVPSGERWYTWRGLEYVSVTTIRQLAGLPFALHQWQLGKVIEAAIDMAPVIMQAKVVPDPLQREAQMALVRTQLRSAATSERDDAAARGTSVHAAIAQGLGVADVPPEMMHRMAHYHDWLRVSRAEVVAGEFQCWNLTLGYAGTADMLCRFPNGQLWLVDLKTGKGIYGDMALQVHGYAMAEFVGRDDVVDMPLTKALHQLSGVAILHLRDDGWAFNVIRWDWETWQAFQGLLAFARWLRLHDRADEIVVAQRAGRAGAA